MSKDLSADDAAVGLSRLLLLHGTIAIALSILVGSVTTIQFSAGLVKFGGLEYAPRVTVLSAVRVLGPAVSTSAALFALLVWTHRANVDAPRSHIVRAAPVVVVASILATPITTALTIASGFLTSRWLYGVPWEPIMASGRILTLTDIPAAVFSLAWSAALNGVFCWFALPVMQRRSWSLLHKLGATWAAFALLRIVSELAAAASRLVSDP